MASSAQREIRNINSKLNDALAKVDAKYADDIKAIQDRIQDLRSQANAKTEDLDARIEELEKFIDKEQVIIDGVREEKFNYEKTYRQLEAEVGPIKYIAEFIYGENANEDLLEQAVRWVIIIIIFVFDPLAVLLLIASQYTFQYVREDKGPRLPPKSDPDPEDPNDPEPEGKFEDVSKEELAEEDRRELEQLRAEKIAKNVPPVIENQKSYSEMMEEELEPRPEPKPVEDGFDPAEVEGYEEFNKKYDEPTPEEEAKKDEEEMRKALEEIDVEEEAKDLDKWNKWVKAAEEEVAKEDAKKEETISDKEFPDTKNRIFYGEEVKQIDEAQKKTVKGTNYITKVSNKQLRQTTNPEDSDPTSQK